MISIKSPDEMARDIAKGVRFKRLGLNLSQKTLSERSGVSYGTVKKFERTGKVSLESLLKIALVLGELEGFERLFARSVLPDSLDKLLQEGTRKRGMK